MHDMLTDEFEGKRSSPSTLGMVRISRILQRMHQYISLFQVCVHHSISQSHLWHQLAIHYTSLTQNSHKFYFSGSFEPPTLQKRKGENE